jgi:hypothetical protein
MGGMITLNNSGTQFGDISMRSKGFTYVVEPYEIEGANTVISTEYPIFAAAILANKATIINNMWTALDALYNVNEAFTRRDADNLLTSIYYDILAGTQNGTRNFVAGLFDYKADHVFPVFGPFSPSHRYVGSLPNIADLPPAGSLPVNSAYIIYNPLANPVNIYEGDIYVTDTVNWNNTGPNDNTILDAFLFSYDFIKTALKALTSNPNEQQKIDILIDDILVDTLVNPRKLLFGSLIESLAHQFNLAGAGVNKNALPLNFRRVGKPLAASGSVLSEDSGRVRWSGADELNNQYFAGGLKINGRTGRLEGRPFTSSVRRLARRAANSRTF